MLSPNARRRLPKEKTKDELDAYYSNLNLDKKEKRNIFWAAFLTIVPFVIVMVLLIFGIALLFLI